VSGTALTLVACVGTGTAIEATLPGLRRPSVLGMVSSISKTRLFGSADGAMRVTVLSTSPPAVSTWTDRWVPSASLSSRSPVGAPKTNFTLVMSAMEKPGLPGDTNVPASTNRFSTTPSMGALSVASFSRSWASVACA